MTPVSYLRKYFPNHTIEPQQDGAYVRLKDGKEIVLLQNSGGYLLSLFLEDSIDDRVGTDANELLEQARQAYPKLFEA